jgi:hypothetical protein
MSEMDDVLAQALKDSTTGGVTSASDQRIAAVSVFAEKQIELEAKVKRLEKELADAQSDLKKVAEHDLPNAMIELGSRGFTLTDGSKINVKKVYVANIKDERKPDAFRWMRDHDHEALIKANVLTSFPKGDVDRAEALMIAINKLLAKRGIDGVEVRLDQSVHWQTLRAFVREQIEEEDRRLSEGETIPVEERLPRELLGVLIIDKAEITPPKQTKK